MSVDIKPEDIAGLSPEEKLELLYRVWQAVNQDDSPVPEWEAELIKERLEVFRREGSKGRPWKEVMADLGKQAK